MASIQTGVPTRTAPAFSIPNILLLRSDPRVREWTLMGSPVFIITILGLYLYFSLNLGPRFMKNRQAFPIRPLIVVYNLLMIGLSLYFFVLTLHLTYVNHRAGEYNVLCQGSHQNPDGDYIFLWYAWYYMLTKVLELLDTVFFVFLKKNSHITFLHLFHHTVALYSVFMNVNSGITGQAAMFPILNTAVHIAMYTYYGLSALPEYARPNLWWKRYVTQFQIVQFLALLVHGAIPLFIDCGFPKGMSLVLVFDAGTFAVLFSDFYYRAYTKQKKK